MSSYFKPILIFWLTTSSLFLIAQEDISLDFKQHYDKALELSSVLLYAESIAEMDKAIDLAQRMGLEKDEIQARIDLAEILRKTEDFQSAVEVLKSIKGSEKYPLQHVRLLDRFAAIYHQSNWFKDSISGKDTVRSYLDSAISIAEEHGFEIEEGLLKNQIGYFIDAGPEISLAYHLDAARLLLKNGDEQNYVGAMTKALNIYVFSTREVSKADSVITILLEKLKDKNWYTAEIELYRIISKHQITNKNDSLAYYEWGSKGLQSALTYDRAKSSNQMDNFRVQQETLKFQNDAVNSELALERQGIRVKELTIYLSILGLVIVSIAILFYRERRLKRSVRQINSQLEVANQKYQMLMVESNHRIKNNLQMIISMLEFAGKDLNPNNRRAIDRMSGKIHTISALHKHLYFDIHNEHVSLQTFFQEIIKLYTEISSTHFIVTTRFYTVKIRSERIIYFGLIFNEMLSNTLEHCKADIKKVEISITEIGEDFMFDYKDDSPWPDDYAEGTGSLLIKQLIDRVGGADFIFNPNSGQFKFSFHAEG